MHELLWITMCWSRVRWFVNYFHESHKIMSENHWEIASQGPKSSFMVTNALFYFLHAILCSEQTIPLKTVIDHSFCLCRQGRSFLTQHCDITTVHLWCHRNAKYWYYDVIYIDCSCKHKLVQRRSSLMNNNHEYWFLNTQYTRLSV